eukprot:1151760-Pelagomonas_calceolata.AAC.13
MMRISKRAKMCGTMHSLIETNGGKSATFGVGIGCLLHATMSPIHQRITTSSKKGTHKYLAMESNDNFPLHGTSSWSEKD